MGGFPRRFSLPGSPNCVSCLAARFFFGRLVPHLVAFLLAPVLPPLCWRLLLSPGRALIVVIGWTYNVI